MKTKFGGLILAILIFAAALARAQTNDLTSLLQQGLLEEQANRNLDAAIADYQTLAAQFDKNRQIAATAIFRLGECYRMQNKTNEAAVQYQRILKDFSDQPTLATLSRQNLTGMGISQTPANAGATANGNTDVALWNKLKNLDKNELPSILPTLVSDPVLETLLQQRNEMATKLAQLKVDFAPGNLNVTRQQTALDEINRQIGGKVVGIMRALQMRAELATATGSEAGKDFSGSSIRVTSDEDQEIQRIQTMIQNSPDLINAPGKDGNTPLTDAASAGQLKVAAFLLDHGADVNAGGNPALNAAAAVGNRAMVEFLLSRGANVNSQGSQGKTPLNTAVEKDFQAVTDVLLANKADVNVPDNVGNTPFLTAVATGKVKLAQRFLAVGANPNLETAQGRTPLSFAAGSGGPEMVKLLLAAKADPNGGKLATPLLVAIHKQDVASTEMLLQAGANPNAKGKVNWSGNVFFMNGGQPTPLWLAISENQFPMVQLLLKYKADPNDLQTDNRPLLFSALNDTNILEALLDAGAKVDARDSAAKAGDGRVLNWTSLLFAVENNSPAASVEILLKHGANPNMRDSAFGQTPLHWIVGWGDNRLPNQRVLELLLDDKADPNVRNNSGKTPLDLFKMQLAAGNISAEQKTAIAHLADLLRQHGALDKLPDWDAITVSRPAVNFSQTIFQQGTNDWNQFTLLEAIFNFYQSSSWRPPFPDLAHVTIIRPSHDSTNETRIEVNLLNGTNGIDGAKDVPLQFGDVVEIPERDHALGDAPVGLTDSERETIANYLQGKVQLVTHGQKVELPIYPTAAGSLLTSVIQQPAAQKVLLSSSDLSRVKVIRHNAKTGKQQEWMVDCSDKESSANSGSPSFGNLAIVNGTVNLPNENGGQLSSGLWLRDGDVIEVPEK